MEARLGRELSTRGVVEDRVCEGRPGPGLDMGGAQEVEAERVEPASGDLTEVEAEGQGLNWGRAEESEG